MWSNKEADFFPEINKSFTFPGMGLINILAKTIGHQESLNINFSKHVCLIWLKLRIKFSLCNRHILISNRATSFCLYNHLKPHKAKKKKKV